MCLDLELCPDTISTLLFETPRALAKSFISSALAAPSTGGAAILTFKAPSISPVISDRDARGTTRTVKVTAPSFSERSIKVSIPDEHVQYYALQEHYQDEHQHAGDVEHPDRRDHPLNREHDRVGNAFYEPEKRISREHEPR